MHLQCIQEGMTISRETVSILMQLLDPEGIELRLKRRLRRRQYYAKGPDYIWHMDSYDKLKRYGLCINGCIDGFSRNIIWLNAYITSSDPQVIAGYYIEVVEEKKGVPKYMRGDLGTENGHVSQMQEFLTLSNTFMYGRSTSNQRIEMFCNFLRKQCCQHWMDVLGELLESGCFTGDYLDKNLIQYCFLRLLQEDLDSMKLIWNSHVIRPSKNQNCPSGKPVVMYELPAVYNTQSYLMPVEQRDIRLCREECVFRQEQPVDDDIYQLCVIYMEEYGWTRPADLSDASDLYRKLRQIMRDL